MVNVHHPAPGARSAEEGPVLPLVRRRRLVGVDAARGLALVGMMSIHILPAWDPETFAPTAHARRVARVGGWSMALSGLVYAGLWAFAPFDVALIGGCAAIILGMAVTIGYCLSMRGKATAA